jgi:hypothetical protein
MGLDFSEFQTGMARAAEVARSNSGQMSAALKQSSREGIESLRLLDEGLGIHLSRPLTRIIGQSQILGGALASVFAISAGFAIGTVVVEEGKKLLEMTGALDGWKQMLGLAGETAEDVAKGMSRQDEAILSGLRRKMEMQDAYNQLVLGLKGGDFERAHLESLKQETAEIQKQIVAQIQLVQARASEQGWRGTAVDVAQTMGGGAATGLLTMMGITAAKDMETSQVAANKMAEAMKPLFDEIKKGNDEIQKTKWKAYRDDVDDAAKAAKEAQEKIAALHKEMASSLAKLQPETDPFKKLDSEIAGFRSSADTAFREIGRSAASALAMSAALAGLDSYGKKLDELKIKLEGDILAKQALELLEKPLPGGQFTSTTPKGSGFALPQPVPPVIPTLGSGGTAAAQFDAFSKDTLAQNKLVASAFQDAVTPTEEYQLKLQELKLAFANLPEALKNSVQATEAFNAALAKLGAEETKAELHLLELQKNLDELLSHSTSASDGVKAFFLQLNIESSQTGKFAFDILNQGLKGFEDELTKAVFTGKAKWEDLFRSMTESAFKFMLNKDIAGIFDLVKGTGVGKSVIGLFNKTQGAGQGESAGGTGGASGLPDFMNLPKSAFGSLPSMLGGGSGAQLATAATTLQTGATTLVTAAGLLQTAATTLSTSGITGAAGGGGGAVSGVTSFFASGTDDAPGGMAWVGEQGPELLNLPTGSAVTPAAKVGGGDSVHNWNIDARGNEDVGERIVRAITLATPAIQARTMAAVQEVQKRTPQGR